MGCSSYSISCLCSFKKCPKIMPETAVETPAPPANETIKEEAVKADAENATEEKKDEEKPSEETKTKEAEAKEPKPKKEKKPKEPAPPPPPAVHKKDFEKEVVYVYQFNRTATVPSISPACLKLETWLKLNGIKFETVNHNSKLRSKRGLLPFVELNGEEICDSDYIIKQLAAKFEKEDPAANLTPEQKNVQHAMVTMVENHLQWAIMHWRVKNADNTLKGFHLDLVAFSQIALVLNVDDSENGAKCPLKEFINADCTNLVGLVTRMKDRAWGDHWDEAIGEKMELTPHIPKPDPPKEEEKEEKKEAADDKKEEDKEKADSDEKEKEEEKKEEAK